jgi:hypothetical protein
VWRLSANGHGKFFNASCAHLHFLEIGAKLLARSLDSGVLLAQDALKERTAVATLAAWS